MGEVSEHQRLLPKSKSTFLKRRFFITRKCITSRAALLILLGSFPVTLLCMLLLYPHTYKFLSTSFNLPYAGLVCSFIEAIVFCFYPVAGYLADIKVGRYKMILGSLTVFIVGLLFVLPGTIGVASISFHGLKGKGLIIGMSISSMMLITGVLLLMGSFIGLKANVIQHGLDQLYDSPSESQSLYVHWYVWTCYVALLTKNMVVSPIVVQGKVSVTFASLLALTYLLVVVIATFTSCLMYRNSNWFYIDRVRLNPYRLVIKASQFACKHKVPIRRSAFTFCEDNLPGGLDLGKQKYGGPYTTEQVEDVKAFYGMLRIILCLGPIFFLNAAANPSLPLSSSHLKTSDGAGNATAHTLLETINLMLFGGNILYPLIIVISIPIYVILIRPFMYYTTPGMLKRIGIGICILILSLCHILIIDTLTHSENKQLGCIFDKSNQHQSLPKDISIATKWQYTKNLLVFLQSVLLGTSYMLIYISIYEFICSQSPHSMKGLVIGIFFATEGTFGILGSLAVLPFSLGWPSSPTFPSCGMTYYTLQITLGLMALVLYSYMAKRYRFRIRDEPCQVRMFVEEYYSNIQRQRLAHGSDSFKL